MNSCRCLWKFNHVLFKNHKSIIYNNKINSNVDHFNNNYDNTLSEAAVHRCFIKQLSRRKMPKLHLNSWCGIFLETHCPRRVSGGSPESKMCVSSKSKYKEIR